MIETTLITGEGVIRDSSGSMNEALEIDKRAREEWAFFIIRSERSMEREAMALPARVRG